MLARRDVVKGVLGLPLAAVLASPVLARSVASSLPDVTIKTAAGPSATATFAETRKASAPTILLVHEWWGLNDQIKSVAAEFAGLGYHALAVDLYGGEVATSPDGARALMQAVKPAEAIDTVVAWSGWLKEHKASNGRIGTVGLARGESEAREEHENWSDPHATSVARSMRRARRFLSFLHWVVVRVSCSAILFLKKAALPVFARGR